MEPSVLRIIMCKIMRPNKFCSKIYEVNQKSNIVNFICIIYKNNFIL